MPDGVLIRDARPEDRPRLIAFMAALQDLERETEPNRTPGAECGPSHLAALEAWAAQDPAGGVLVAEAGKQPVGFLVFGVEEELGTYVPKETRRVGNLSDLWIKPGFRGIGIARTLIAAAEARLRNAGLTRVEVSTLPDNAAARALYRRLGYADCLITLARRL